MHHGGDVPASSTFPQLVRLIRFVFTIALAILAGSLQAQSRPGRIRGVVVDSLLGATLPGARVHLAPLNRDAGTDSAGRFIFDSVPPGEWAVSFHHPALDALRLVEPAAQVRVFAGATTVVTLATRAFEAVRDPLCADTPDSLSSTVAFGAVRTADGSAVRMQVTVTWMLAITPDGVPRSGTVRMTYDGQDQAWFACGIVEGGWFRAMVRDSTRSASALLKLGSRGVVVRDLYLSTGVARIAGTVRDEAGRPVQQAHVSIVDSDLAAETDEAGVFILPDAPNGTISLDVRAAGHRPWIGALDVDRASVEARLQPLGEPRAEPPFGSDYFRLLERRNRRGMLLVTEQELKDEATELASLLPPETCRWWLDGRPVDAKQLLAQARSSLRALELYLHGDDAPPEHRTSGCAVALLWTVNADW